MNAKLICKTVGDALSLVMLLAYYSLHLKSQVILKILESQNVLNLTKII